MQDFKNFISIFKGMVGNNLYHFDIIKVLSKDLPSENHIPIGSIVINTKTGNYTILLSSDFISEKKLSFLVSSSFKFATNIEKL